MATPDQILILRGMINQPDNVAPWTDEYLGAVIDANQSLNAAAASVWEAKAATVAHLVDISEGGSSRKQGDIYEQFLAMAKLYKGEDENGVAGRRAPRTRAIERA